MAEMGMRWGSYVVGYMDSMYMVIRFGQLAALGVAEEKAVGHALEIFGVRLGF